MRALVLVFVLFLFIPINASYAAVENGDGQKVQGLWLTTRYPALSISKGEPATVSLVLRNYDLPPTRVDLSVENVPAGWSAEFRGGGQPVRAAMAPTDDKVTLDLRLEPPADAKPGAYNLVVRADGAERDVQLPLLVTIAEELPPKLSLEPEFPELVGTASSNFDFRISLKNDSGRDLLVNLGAEAPDGFQVSFTEAYGSQELTSIPVKAGESKDVKAKVALPQRTAAGRYEVTVAAAAEGVEARTNLGLKVTGEPTLSLSARDGRLSAEAVAGESSTLALVLGNTGSAPARDVKLSASPPSGWEVTFDPKSVDAIAPGATQEVMASLTPTSRAIAGDYMVPVRATGDHGSDSADFRVTVSTPTVWGMVGVGVVAVALVILFGAVLRFGRR